MGPLAEYDPIEEDDPLQTIGRNRGLALGQASSSSSSVFAELDPTHDSDNGDLDGMGSESAFTKSVRFHGEHQATASSTLGPNIESTEGRQRQHKDPEDEVHTQVVEEDFKSLSEITHELVWGHAGQSSSGDSDYTGTQTAPVPVTLEKENVRHREHEDPADKLHSQVVDEGVKPLLEIKHESVREHYVWGSPEQAANDESDYTGTQSGPVPNNMGSTLEVIDSIDEDLFQMVLRQRKHAEGSDSVWIDSSPSTDGELLELAIDNLDTDFDAVTSNLINRHREHTTTLTTTDSTSPGIQIGLDSNDGDAVGLDLTSEDFELIPEPAKTEATASAQLFSTIQPQNVAPTGTAPSLLRVREHDAKTPTVGAGEGGGMYSTDIQILSASGTPAVRGFQNSETKPTLRKRAHKEPTGTLEADKQPVIESSNEELFPSRAPNISINRRRKHDADVPFVSNASPSTSPTKSAMIIPGMTGPSLL